jgi:hypothetical protein
MFGAVSGAIVFGSIRIVASRRWARFGVVPHNVLGPIERVMPSLSAQP